MQAAKKQKTKQNSTLEFTDLKRNVTQKIHISSCRIDFILRKQKDVFHFYITSQHRPDTCSWSTRSRLGPVCFAYSKDKIHFI